MSFYLGPGRPLTALGTWNELVHAGQGGLLGERQWIELKKDIGPTSKSTNAELAADLASLALDGGLLIFGVDDSGVPVGCDPQKIMQRVSQVAAHGVTPPLSPVVHDPVEHPDGSSSAVVVVEVPASATAPHQAKEKYWGRSSDGKRPLADPEVRRVLEVRHAARSGFEQRLQTLVDRDPVAAFLDEEPTNGHLFFLAAPIGAVPATSPLVDSDTLRYLLSELPASGWASGLEHCGGQAHDPDGTALSTLPRGLRQRDERNLTIVSVRDDRSIAIVGGGATARWQLRRGPEVNAVLSGLATRLVVQGLELVRTISLDRWGYSGEWHAGVHLTGLLGRPSNEDPMGTLIPFAHSEYTRVTTTTPIAWERGTEVTAKQLMSGLYRGLGLPEHMLEQNIRTGR